MAKNKDNEHLYVGRAGHLVVMAECLSRGWNVAIPEVDVGEDIFVVEDTSSKLAKVQVKTATGKTHRNGFTAQFLVPLKQLNDDTEKGNDMRYVFVTRFKRKWQPFVIISRENLEKKYKLEHIGSDTANKEVKLTFYYTYDKIFKDRISNIDVGSKRGFDKQSMNSYIENWNIFFTIRIVEGNMYQLKLRRLNPIA